MAIKSIAGRFAKKFAKRLSAKQLAASRRNIQKAIAASARKRGKAVVGVAKNPFKAYGRSVVRRSVKRKTKVLNKLKSTKVNSLNLSQRIATDIDKYNRQTAIFKGKNVGLSKEIKRTGQKYLKLDVIRDAATGKPIPRKNTIINRVRLRKVLNQNEQLVNQYNTNVTLIKLNNSLVTQLEGRKGEVLNIADKAAAHYDKIAKQSLSFKAGTVARDVAVVGAAGGLTYAGIKERNKRKNRG